MDCIFCKIISKEIPSKLIHEDEWSIAFPDINPQAPTHLLIVPKQHIAKMAESHPEDTALLGHLLSMARQISSKSKLNDYRIVINNGSEAGQTVWHLHLHLLSGRPFAWPPG